MTDPRLLDITETIRQRSRASRAAYLNQIKRAQDEGPARGSLSCGNLAHGVAACGTNDKDALSDEATKNIAIVSAYNDMLSAHQPFEAFPGIIKDEAHRMGAVAQFAGGVPAMCDGITQGQDGMDLSLMSRDVIAQAAAIALSHNMFDAALMLGVCDKIVPGLVIAAQAFGHLPIVFVPAGPMPTGLANKKKAAVREAFAKGEADRETLLAAEKASYHSPGTCTFYGTANTNQMLMEFMGLHLPGTSFVPPNTPLRDALTRAATRQAAAQGTPAIGHILDERAFVNGIVGLMATGGSTNLTIHLIAMARAGGIDLNWDDFAALSDLVPLLVRAYPNGDADVNAYHAAGGLALTIRTLLDEGLLHEDVLTIMGPGLQRYTQEPILNDDQIIWRDGPATSGDEDIIRPAATPFATNGGLKVLSGNLGRGIIKISAVVEDRHIIEAPAKVFDNQAALMAAYEAGDLHCDCICVVRQQGPKANGMPELHKLTPPLGVLQSLGYNVALVTDGRMSGASGKVPAAIHVTPEAVAGGPIAKIKDGDVIRLDADAGALSVLSDDFDDRPATTVDAPTTIGLGRELFTAARQHISGAEQGGSILLEAGKP